MEDDDRSNDSAAGSHRRADGCGVGGDAPALWPPSGFRSARGRPLSAVRGAVQELRALEYQSPVYRPVSVCPAPARVAREAEARDRDWSLDGCAVDRPSTCAGPAADAVARLANVEPAGSGSTRRPPRRRPPAVG